MVMTEDVLLFNTIHYYRHYCLEIWDRMSCVTQYWELNKKKSWPCCQIDQHVSVVDMCTTHTVLRNALGVNCALSIHSLNYSS